MRMALREEPFTRHVVHFQADAIGVFKKYGIVPRRPRAVLGRVDYAGTDADEEIMHRVHVHPLPYPKADVVQPNPELDEALALVALFGPHDAVRRPPTAAVNAPFLLDGRAHPQSRAQALKGR